MSIAEMTLQKSIALSFFSSSTKVYRLALCEDFVEGARPGSDHTGGQNQRHSQGCEGEIQLSENMGESQIFWFCLQLAKMRKQFRSDTFFFLCKKI